MRLPIIIFCTVVVAAGAYAVVGSSSEDSKTALDEGGASTKAKNPASSTQSASHPSGSRKRPELEDVASVPPAPLRYRGARGEGEDRRGGRRSERLKQFDIDGDGQLSEEERSAMRQGFAERRRERILEFFDSDGDGELDEDELAMQEQAREDRQAERFTNIMTEVDADEDGMISRNEVAEGGSRQVRRLLRDFESVDQNSDEQISPEELQQSIATRRKQRRRRRQENTQDAPK